MDGAGDRRPWVVMLSATPWAGGANRQHAIAAELGGTAVSPFRVLFVDPPLNRPGGRLRIEADHGSLWLATLPTRVALGRQLGVCNRIGRAAAGRTLSAFLDRHPGERIVWIDEDLAWPLAGRLGEVAVVYDATDLDWTFTHRWNRAHLRHQAERAVASADLVLASSSALPSRMPRSRHPPIVVANACDPDLFALDGPLAPECATLPRPIVGYLGAVDRRAFDAELVAEVARSHPEWTFVLAGPVQGRTDATLATLANVHLLGPVRYADAPALVRAFDVAIIPYRLGGLVDYVHPKKLYEYLAVGKPVVATPLPALVTLQAPIRLAGTANAFAAEIGAALNDDVAADRVKRRRSLAEVNSWSARGDELRALVAELLAGVGRR